MIFIIKKTVSIITIVAFISTVYLIPSANAITLGEIKTDNGISQDKEDVKGADKKIPLESEKGVKSGEDLQPREKKDQTRKEVSPRLVCLLSIMLPGGGHFYMNNDAKGMSFCLAAGAGYTLTGFFMVKTMLADRGTVAYKNYLLLSGFIFFITLIIHFVGIIEAYSDADEINKKNLFESGVDDPYSFNIEIEK
ncbi:MAG TPA: hypothetical protein P5120_03290 [Spirochaetota bacterium]|nr:hypothetical protein [Spirochaetota bacterium]HPF05243.1 hypothetical protein [Spirochaetota bacterium]HPR37168.1 hypothetical protein [Spirochaetota bacterium]HRX46519.1 hypothetical protein [Spirochaetota bacterium]